ncbi:response regulator [Pseudocolwellia agarivorans]|uniref:response regulator n=1 Tax=Pseudocolwellia agarivorans TaxID=1911682 RepID=UPI000985F2C8|nr:response regulator [Pseudocolwellia agarivorans]
MTNPIKSVLLVEDDEDDYLLTSDYLQQVSTYQFDIQWTDSSVEALELLKQNKHDICLLDYQLGSINGLAVLKQAINAGCTIPIIMLTGQSDNQLDNDALDAGAVDYVVKSELNTTRFHRAIRYALSRKEIENERLERIKAETRSRSKDKFVAHLSHELRTPLTSILGYTELLLFNKENSHIHAELSTILDNGKHLLGLLNNVLDLSKIAADKLELNYTHIALDNFIIDLYALMSVTAQDKGIVLKINAKTPLPLHINADAIRLRQVFINLIHNAIKFTDKGSVTVDIWLDRNNSNNSKNSKNTLHFTITDTGIGIPTHLLATIFKPFEQVEDIVSRNEEGAGLGLAICCELLKQMGGTIEVESTENVGSKFIITLELGDISHTTVAPLSFNRIRSQATTENFPQITGHVLIVDDLKDIRNLIGFICRSFGLKTSFAVNGEHAITKILEAQEQGNPFNSILMDIHMPVLDGKRTILKLREMGITTQIIAVTAATMKGVHQELKSLGFNDVVAKPVDKHALYQSLTQSLARNKNTRVQKNPLNQPAKNTFNTTENAASPSKHFLIIEDDKDAAQVTALLLNNLNIEASIAHSAAEATTLLTQNEGLSNHQYDQILLDINLPDANGLVLSKQLRILSPNSKITIISGNAISQDVLTEFSIDQALLKPINLTMLKQIT